jgi:LPXTG-motif cell wall-anchored protein
MQLTLFGIALILLVAWLYLRRRKSAVPPPTPKSLTETGSGRYHAVSIKFDSNACEAARAMSGRRFLSAAAPRLPLPDCDAANCNCRFAHHKDRRSGSDRRSPFAAAGFGGGTGSFEKERREKAGRRTEDADGVDDF